MDAQLKQQKITHVLLAEAQTADWMVYLDYITLNQHSTSFFRICISENIPSRREKKGEICCHMEKTQLELQSPNDLWHSYLIKQLDVGASPPAFSFTLIVTLTFDPDLLWPLTLTPLTIDLLQNLVTLGQTVFPSDFFSSICPRWTDRRTDRRRCLRAHRAWAQVGSKMRVNTHL